MKKVAIRAALILTIAISALAFGHPPFSHSRFDTPAPANVAQVVKTNIERKSAGGIAGFPCPNPGAACCEGTTVVGCEDAACCNLVCSMDPFCCETLWDNLCGALAQQICSYCGGAKPLPSNDNCASAIEITDGEVFHFSTIGATTDGPPIENCLLFVGDPQVRQDVWYRVIAQQTGLLKISVCDSDFNTRLAVYGSCPCPVSAADEIVCNDNSPNCGDGLQSQLKFVATQGECYTVRIGGFETAEGTGTMTLDFAPCFVQCPPGSMSDFETCGDDKDLLCSGPLPGCDGPFTDCCVEHVGVGCSDPACTESICASDPYCCNDQWDALCAAEACSDPNCQCEPGSYPPTALNCGIAACGTFFANQGVRDTDIFDAHAHDARVYRWSVTATVPVVARITSPDCENPKVLASASGKCPIAEAFVTLGTYFLIVEPENDNGVDCFAGDDAYVATLTCDVCFTDINDSGATDVDDLLIVINGWGPCDQTACDGDVDRSGTTNVDDLLYVINRWGPCP